MIPKVLLVFVSMFLDSIFTPFRKLQLANPILQIIRHGMPIHLQVDCGRIFSRSLIAECRNLAAY
jgi:hypothetical protein